jgi:hypothetical protein
MRTKKFNLGKLIFTFLIMTSVLLMGGCLSININYHKDNATNDTTTTSTSTINPSATINIDKDSPHVIIHQSSESSDTNTVVVGSQYFTFEFPEELQANVSPEYSTKERVVLASLDSQFVSYTIDDFSGDLGEYMEYNKNQHGEDYETILVNGKPVYYTQAEGNDSIDYTVYTNLETEEGNTLLVLIDDFENLPIEDLITKYISFTDVQWNG